MYSWSTLIHLPTPTPTLLLSFSLCSPLLPSISYHLIGFWKSAGEENSEQIWGYTQKFIQLDTKKGEGNELDEFWSHKFLETLGETLTIVQLREQMRKVIFPPFPFSLPPFSPSPLSPSTLSSSLPLANAHISPHRLIWMPTVKWYSLLLTFHLFSSLHFIFLFFWYQNSYIAGSLGILDLQIQQDSKTMRGGPPGWQ